MYKKLIVRAVRKSAHLSHKSSLKLSRYSKRVEHRATQIISGQKSLNVGAQRTTSIDELLLENLPQITPIKPMLPATGRKPTVTLLLPTVNKNLFFGGVATAIISASLLAKQKNFNLRVVATFKGGHADIKSFLAGNGIVFNGEIELLNISVVDNFNHRELDIHPEDIYMASAWPDAYVLELLPLKRKFVYLMQDYEPIFFSNSDERVLAEYTYANDNYVALCNTKLMYDHMLFMGHDNVKEGTWFEPAVSHQDKTSNKLNKNKKRMFVYARPRVKRNLYYNALMAIDDVFASGGLNPDEWEVFAAGQDDVPEIKLSSGITIKNLGKMSMGEYYDFTSTVDIALTPMMAPHPNYPTLELASVGAAVVTTKYNLKQDLSGYSKNIITTEPDYKSMSLGLIQASKMNEKTKLKNASTANINKNWIEALKGPIDKISKII